jgi:hypothetical protein
LPDGFFSNQKYQFGQILEGFRGENVDIFYGLWEYFMDIWDILLPFGTFVVIWYFCGHLVHFFWFGYHVPTKTWQPWSKRGFT